MYATAEDRPALGDLVCCKLALPNLLEPGDQGVVINHVRRPNDVVVTIIEKPNGKHVYLTDNQLHHACLVKEK